MNPSNFRLSLRIGQAVPAPAPGLFMSALESVEVNQSDDGSAAFQQGFQIVFRADRNGQVTKDYALVQHPLLKPGNRVIITITLKATPQVLIDGIITHQEFTPASGPGSGARLVVTGKDLSVLMDMVELAMPYPALNHAAIVLMVLAKYAAYGVVPMVIPPLTNWTTTPLDKIPYQRGTDRSYLRQLASNHGYVFGVKPGPAPGANIAYWGPLIRVGLPQKALTVDMGADTNVDTINFSNDALAPEQLYGLVHLRDSKIPVPVLTLAGIDVPLAKKPAMISNQPFVRKSRLTYQGNSAVEAYAEAQSRTNRSVEGVVTGTGTLNALRYGSLLTAPGLVGVRGAGETYDGIYYVKSVKHQIAVGQYTQSFTLMREGTGSLVERL